MTEDDAAREHYRRRKAQRHAQRERERLAWLARAQEAILRLAPCHPGVQEVYLFGSLLQPGRFRPDSDIDVAVICESLEAESAFWRALEHELQRDVDVRPATGAVAEAIASGGMRVYGRKDPCTAQ